ncbi:MAG: methyltransferase domain-containing protein [Terracidiphilus sp.]|jgi:2-polyprenyl-3-methyl-5-hydroxy-6-metoxy-1,4-benzoquinol methylase
MRSANDNVELFDQSAETFARGTDALIEAGSYIRGDLFTGLASRYFRSGGRVLDYGCGPGRIALVLGRKGYDVIGVDKSPGMIHAARRISSGSFQVQFHLVDSFPVLFDSNEWDGIICSSVIEYIEDPLITLRSFFTALRPGGAVILSYANARTFWRLRTLSQRKCYPHLNFQYNVWKWSEAREVFTKAGFEILLGPRYFESPFDKYRGLRFLSWLGCIGTLGLVVLGKRT